MGVIRDLWRMWRTDWPHDRVRRVLVLQTANPPSFNKILCAVRRRFEGAEIEMAIHAETEKTLPRDHGCRMLFINRKNKSECVKELKSRGYDTVVVQFCAERGFWKLKLLPFLLGARQVLAYNESADAYALNRRHARIIFLHVKWRAGQFIRRGTGAHGSLLRALAAKTLRRALAGPAFLWLLWRAAGWELKRRRNA